MGITSDASSNESPTTIRLATERDAEQVAALYAPNVTDSIISFELEPPSADEMRRRIEGTLERFPWLVCERQGRVLGYAYAGAHGPRAAYRWSVDVSVYVHWETQRAGTTWCSGTSPCTNESRIPIRPPAYLRCWVWGSGTPL